MEKKTRTALVLVLLLVAGAGVGYAVMSSTYDAGPGITYDAGDSGPAVELGEGAELSAERPFPDEQTVDLHPYGTISSAGDTSMRVGNPDADFVTLTQIETNGNTITADWTDQTGVEFEGPVDSLSVRDVNTASNEVDLSHDGDATLKLLLGESGQYVAKDADSGELLDASTGPDPTFELSGSNDVTIVDSDSTPVISNASPTDDISTTDVTLEADIEDPDGGEMDVDLLFGDEVIESKTIEEEGSISATPENVTAGENDWSVEATNQFGDTTTESFTFGTPETLTIRDVTSPGEKLTTESEVEVTFLAGDELFVRSTTDGTIDMEGLPIKAFVVEVETADYVTRQSVLGSIVEQQNVYMLPESVEIVRPEFLIDDTTGAFDPDQSRILVERPITRDGETKYEVVAGDDFGSSGFSTSLQADQRYRIVVENTETGERQSLGPYVASNSERVTLQVDTIDFEFDDSNIGYDWGTRFENPEDGDPSVQFGFKAEENIKGLDVEIYQRGGDETVVLSESYSDVERISETALLNQIEDPEANTYVVEWEGVITTDDGEEEISGSEVVGSDQMPVNIPGVGDDVMQVVGVFILLMISGLFSAANVNVGAVVLSIMAGGMWFAGLLPGVASGLLIGTALLVSIIWQVKDQRGQQ